MQEFIIVIIHCCLQSINTVSIYLFQTFVYLFAPICANIRESDFNQNFRLENGKQIWQAMWEYRHPDAEGFIAPVSNTFYF